MAGRGASRAEWAGVDRAVAQGLYDRMRRVAPAAFGALERDRADDAARPFADTACGRLAASLDRAGLRALGMWAHHWVMRHYDDDTRVGLRLVREVAALGGLGWTADEVRWMLGESARVGAGTPGRLTLPVAAAAGLPPDALPADVPPAPPADAGPAEKPSDDPAAGPRPDGSAAGSGWRLAG